MFFLDPSPKAKVTKANIIKWDLVKLKCFCTAKETIDKMKGQTTKWEKMSANDMTNKGLVFNVFKELIQLNIKKTKQAN